MASIPTGWGAPDIWGGLDVWTDASISDPGGSALGQLNPLAAVGLVISPLITYRSLGPYGDPLWGQGKANLLSDVYAVAQAVRTRLKLFTNEWWADLSDGTPMFQSILATSGDKRNVDQVMLILRQRIMDSPYVTGVSNAVATFDAPNRFLSFSAAVETQFGQLTISNQPYPPSQALP